MIWIISYNIKLKISYSNAIKLILIWDFNARIDTGIKGKG
jgi:hypothetical protein